MWPRLIGKFGRGDGKLHTKARTWPMINTEWRHKKRQSEYVVIGKVRLQYSTVRPEDGELLVLYQNTVDGSYSARLPEEFLDGRFQKI